MARTRKLVNDLEQSGQCCRVVVLAISHAALEQWSRSQPPVDESQVTRGGRLTIELGKGDRTVLISSHLLGEVELMCTRVGVIRKGKIVAEGTVDQLRGAATLAVRATPEETAKAILIAEAGAEKVTALGDATFSVRVDLQHTADINKHLVQAGVSVTELPHRRTLARRQ